MYNLTRRRLIALGLSATAAAVAGCRGPGSTGTEPYANWLPASSDGTVTAYIDFTLSEDSPRINPVLPLFVPTDGQQDGDANLAPTLSNLDEIDDRLLTFPLRTGGRVLGGAIFSLAVIGLGKLVDPARPTEGVTELFFADGVAVGMGDIETSEVDERLRSGPDRARFEVVGNSGEFTLYDTVTENGGFAAVGETAVLVSDGRERVEAVLDTRRGEREHAAAGDDTFASLLDATDSGHVLVGWEAPVDLDRFTFGEADREPAGGLVSTEDDVVGSVTFDPDDGEITADLAFSDTDGVNRARLDDRLGSASAERSISVDGGRVTVSGTYPDDTLGLDYVAQEGDTAVPTVPSEENLPPEVARAVPDDPFEFTFVTDEEVVRVDFPAGVDADRVTLRAVESGYEISTTTPDGIQSMNVFVDPDSDVVVVTVTEDGVSAAVARHEVP